MPEPTQSAMNGYISSGRRCPMAKMVKKNSISSELAPGASRIMEMSQTTESKNKALVLEAFDTLFNKRDYVAAERYWSPNYIQHSAHIAPGREGLFNLIKSIPPTLRYEPGVILAEGCLLIVHGGFSSFGLRVNWIAADILRIKDGILVEHWDVIQDEATREQSKSGLPMFGDAFPKRAQLTSGEPASPPLFSTSRIGCQ